MTRFLSSLVLFLAMGYFGGFAQAQEKNLRKFHWGVTSLSASQWIPWIAKEAKLYEKYGMEAELVLLRGSFLKSNKEFAMKVLSKYLKTTDRELLEGSYEIYCK